MRNSKRGRQGMKKEGFYNCDCMEAMREYPDKYFDLAIVDPPYGSGGVEEWERKQEVGRVLISIKSLAEQAAAILKSMAKK